MTTKRPSPAADILRAESLRITDRIRQCEGRGQSDVLIELLTVKMAIARALAEVSK